MYRKKICYLTDMFRKNSEKQYKGIWDCAKKTVSRNGFFGLYSGILICLVGEIIYRGSKYGLYDGFKVRIR